MDMPAEGLNRHAVAVGADGIRNAAARERLIGSGGQESQNSILDQRQPNRSPPALRVIRPRIDDVFIGFKASPPLGPPLDVPNVVNHNITSFG